MGGKGGEGRPRPRRLERLPEQYFAALLGRIAATAAEGGPPVVDFGRGNPETGPPGQVVEALHEAASRPDGHGYGPMRGLPALREAIAHRYRTEYGVELDPEREVAVVPGGKSALLELALVLGERGRTILVPDPYYPDYPSGIALSGAEMGLVPLYPSAGWQPDLETAPSAAALYLNFPSNPCAVTAHAGLFGSAVGYAQRTGTTIVHDAAYIDLVFYGRAPESFLATPGAVEAGVELWTMSKTYGMAGWRIAFVVGNSEIVERLNVIGDHSRVGMLAALQHAAIAALEGPQASVEERRATYERRRDSLAAALPEPPLCEGSFYVWLQLPGDLTPERLLTEHRVALAPGEGFGPSGAGWARLSLAVADDVFDEGVARLAPVLEAAYA